MTGVCLGGCGSFRPLLYNLPHTFTADLKSLPDGFKGKPFIPEFEYLYAPDPGGARNCDWIN